MSANSGPGFEKYPDYQLDMAIGDQHVVIEFGGAIVADTHSPLVVRESRHAPVFYLPKEDVRMDMLTPTDESSYCPFKGHASYWTIEVGTDIAANAVWAYEAPYDEADAVKGYVAFYPDRVDRVTVDGESA